MLELTVWSGPKPGGRLRQRRRCRGKYVAAAHPEFMHDRQTERVSESPLFSGAIQVSLVEEIAQPFLEALFGFPANERVKVCRAKKAIPAKRPE